MRRPSRRPGYAATTASEAQTDTAGIGGTIPRHDCRGTVSRIRCPKSGCVPGLSRRVRRHARRPVHDKTVCIIDDEVAMRQSLESLVRSMGVRVRLYASAEAFLEYGRNGPSHCIVCDIQMAGMSGIELLDCLRAGCCDVPLIFVTAHPSTRRLIEARRLGALCVLEKPFDPRELVQWLMRALAGC